MKQKGIRIALAAIEAFIGLSAVGGGIAILTGAFDQWLPVAWLQGTPFRDYLIPGLVLLIVVGGGMVLAATAMLFLQHKFALIFSAAMGLIMIGWEVIEVAIINRYEQAVIPSTIVQQVLFAVLGLIIVGLATYLWVHEYGGHSSLTRHSSHA